MKKKVKIFGKDIKRAVRRGLMENIVEGYEMRDTYSRADYEATPQETEIGGVFGKYEEDIPPAVLRYMRKNPSQIIKRLYDVYGDQMISYITNSGKEGSIEYEEEVVSEEDQIPSQGAGTSYNFNKNPDDWEKFNSKVGATSKIKAKQDGTVDVFSEGAKWIDKAIKRPGALHRELDVPEDEDIPKGLINKEIKKLKRKDKDDKKKGSQLNKGDARELRQLYLSKTLDKFKKR
jgi:hypothetical protein